MSPQTAIPMAPIGVVSTDVADGDVSRRRREIISRVRIFDEFAAGLAGIEDYSHLFVLFWMDRARRPASLLAHPRGDPDLPLGGVFAARGRNHPNSIGLAVVELLEREGSELTVKRLDAFDGTPVLDLKPYDDYDVFPDIKVPAWFSLRAMASRGDLE